jgi:excisionase family DNA binding protein
MKRMHNPNKCKIHRSYTVEEVAELYGVHKRTVRNWTKNGLAFFDGIRPFLILGTDLKLFLINKKKAIKHKFKMSEIYCFRCLTPQKANLETVNFMQQPSGVGRVFMRCSLCDAKVNKFFSWRQLDAIKKEISLESTLSTKTQESQYGVRLKTIYCLPLYVSTVPFWVGSPMSLNNN